MKRRQALPVPPRQALPIPPEQALPTTLRGVNDALRAALLRQDEALRDANGVRDVMLEHVQSLRSDRTARARRAGSTPKQKIASKHAEMVEAWIAEMNHRMQHGGRVEKGRIDKIVADRFEVHEGTVKRARLKAGFK